MKNSVLLNADAAWAKLFQLDLRALDAYELVQYFDREVKPKLEAALKANRGLFDKYGKPDGKGNIQVPPSTAAFKTFAKERQELLDNETNVKPYPQPLGAVLKRAKNAEIDGNSVMALTPFFADEEGAPTKRKSRKKT